MSRSPQLILLATVLTLLGAGLRIAPLFHDLWLDEAWSYLLVHNLVDRPIDVITQLHTDNNHPINSLTTYLLGPEVDWHLIRLPAWISGVLCIPLAGLVMNRFGTAHSAYAMLLVAGSYPLTVYSTEARGYSTMLCCVLLSIEFLARWLASRDWRYYCIFWLSVVLGFLSHLTFIQAYLALMLFSLIEVKRTNGTLKTNAMELAMCHGVPLLFLFTLYWFFIRNVIVAGAELTTLTGTVAETMALSLGGRSGGLIGLVLLLCFVVILFKGLARLREQSEAWHWLFFSGIVLIPLSLMICRRITAPLTSPVFPRYFLTSILLFLLLAGFLLGELHKQPSRRRVIGIITLCCVLSLNAHQIAHFSSIGRGQYQLALEAISRQSRSRPIHLISNSNFRTSLLLSFYFPRLSTPRQFALYELGSQVPPDDVDWLIMEFLTPARPVPGQYQLASGRFVLQHYCDFYGPSGCGWAVYRRTLASAPPGDESP